jgi:transposase
MEESLRKEYFKRQASEKGFTTRRLIGSKGAGLNEEI